MTQPTTPAPIHCSFCGAHQDTVEDIVTGFACAICDNCLDLACDVVAKARAQRAAKARVPA